MGLITYLAQESIKAPALPHTEADSGTLATILSIAFGIIGALAVLAIVISGLRYITSGGNPQRTADAKNGIVYALAGLVVAIMAQAIVAFVVRRI